jgi:hypothetical protein
VGEIGRRSARRLLPATQDVVGGVDAEADGRVAAERAEVDPGRSGARAVPVDQPDEGVPFPQGVALPEVAVDEHAGLPRRRHGRPLLGLHQQGPGRLLAAQGGEVLAGDRPVAPVQRRAGRQDDRVQRGRDTAQRPQPGRRALRRDLSAPGQLLDQDHGPVADELGRQQPRPRDAVLGGYPERRHLGAERGMVRLAADPQHDTARRPAPVEPQQPGRAAVAQAADLDNVGAGGGGLHRPAQQRGIERRHRRIVPSGRAGAAVVGG